MDEFKSIVFKAVFLVWLAVITVGVGFNYYDNFRAEQLRDRQITNLAGGIRQLDGVIKKFSENVQSAFTQTGESHNADIAALKELIEQPKKKR